MPHFKSKPSKSRPVWKTRKLKTTENRHREELMSTMESYEISKYDENTNRFESDQCDYR